MSENMREELDPFRSRFEKARREGHLGSKWLMRCKEKFPNVQGVSLTPNAIRKRYNALA